MGLLLLLLASGAVALPCLIYFAKHPNRLAARSYHLVLGAAVQYLAALPAGFLDSLLMQPRLAGKPVMLRLVVPFATQPVAMGGLTVRTAFEFLARALGLRPNVTGSLVLTHSWLWLLLLAVQVVVVCRVFAELHPGKPHTARNLPVVALVLALVANSLLGMGQVVWAR